MNVYIKHDIKKIRKMNFEEMFNMLSEGNRMELLNRISKYGDSVMILNSLSSDTVYYESKHTEIRINNEYLLQWDKGVLGYTSIMLIKLSEIQYCYHCTGILKYATLGLIYKDGSVKEVKYKIISESDDKVFEKVHSIVRGFENTVSTYSSGKEYGVHKLTYGYSKDSFYYINSREIQLATKKFFSKKYNINLVVPNIQDAVCCCLQYRENGEDADDYNLLLYLKNKKEPVILQSDSCYGAFKLALAIKDNVPHLIYF